MDDDVLAAIGVEIIEGNHPGSSYSVAELRKTLEEANAEAVKQQLNIRFLKAP